MRLAISFQRVDPSKGGAETYVADLCRGLVARGHEVHLFASEWNSQELPEIIGHHVPAQGRTRWGRIESFGRNSEVELGKHSFDCVIGLINTWHQDVLIPQGGVHEASLEANARRFPNQLQHWLYVAMKRSNPKSWWLYRSIEARQYDPSRKTRVVAVSQMVRSHLQRFHGVPAERIRVIPNAIDADRLLVADRQAVRDRVRARHNLAENDLVALFVGHNFRLKGLPPLLESLARRPVESRPIHLFVCGGGRLEPMRKMVERLKLQGRVHLVGFADDIRDYYHASDFFVLPTYYDPCSLVVFEALASGLPVVTTACNGAGEVIEDGCEGFVIPRPDDHEAMIRALEAMTNDDVRREMGRKAVELGRAQSFEVHLTRLLEVCSEVAALKQVPTRRSLVDSSRR